MVVSVGAVAVAVVIATWPVHGRTGEEWLPTVTRWSVDSLSGSRQRLSSLPGRGHRIALSPTALSPTAVGAPHADPRGRGPFVGLSLLACGGGPGRHDVGIVHDVRARTYTAVVALRGHSFALLGPADKERRVAGWASVLGALSRERSGVHRVQWLASTIPDDGRAVRAHLNGRAAVDAGHGAYVSYAELLDEMGASASRHDVHLAVQIRAGHRADRTANTHGAKAGSCGVLLREVAALCRRLEEIDVVVDGALDPEQLCALLRRPTEADPTVVTLRPTSNERVHGRWPWPLSTESSWGDVRTDATVSATYWISEWPRVEVGPDFLGPLLLGPVRRTTAVVMEPLSPSQATRRVEQARTADLADAELRRRGGFISTARREHEAALVVRREAELAEGHASFRFSGYVTVTAATRELLAAACDATEQAAGQARLELRRLYGDQARAFAYTLPLGRGLS